MLPLEDFQISSNQLVFKNLLAEPAAAQEQRYAYNWFAWNNATAQRDAAPSPTSSELPGNLADLGDGAYIGCQITSASGSDARSVTVYFHHEGVEWRLVGVKRRPLR